MKDLPTMRRHTLPFGSDPTHCRDVDVVSVNTVIVGAGAAGLRCAQALYDLGMRDLVVVVDRLGNGTSNKSGSDKQTYYKLGLFGDQPDSPLDFARTLYQGGMMHGDLAYVEALGSVPAFFELCRIGVPFPHNRFGAYVGYKTDHDPRQRATSAGPKTSKFMFERLLEQVRGRQIPILDRHDAVAVLTAGVGESRRTVGVACLDHERHHEAGYGLKLINAQNVVLATGGPGDMYKVSVWPRGQVGSHGMALAAGATANNLTELQYGLASIGFRWNLSGSYQQVVPDYFSTAADGVSDRRHFLTTVYPDMATLATSIFMKGYQWPFHAERLQNHGSSLIDMAVYRERQAGRRVFMDTMHNPTPGPGMEPFRIADLHEEARTYLQRCGATQNLPYARLQHMNQPSIDLYAEHGVDLRQPLEVDVCAQHCNGGLSGNLWWETCVPHLFAIGELCGTHGVRPGGSALNSGQVGALRAAQYIANVYDAPPMDMSSFKAAVDSQVKGLWADYDRYLHDASAGLDADSVRPDIQERMSRAGGISRSLPVVGKAREEAVALVQKIATDGIRCTSPRQLPRATQDAWLALTSVAFLTALQAYIRGGGGSRGGYMILDAEGPLTVASPDDTESLPHRAENVAQRAEILEVSCRPGSPWDIQVRPIPVRPLPADESWFETTWASFNSRAIFDAGQRHET